MFYFNKMVAGANKSLNDLLMIVISYICLCCYEQFGFMRYKGGGIVTLGMFIWVY
jgi:hypothetical protein